MQVLTRVLERPLTGYRAVVASLIGAALTAACVKLAFYLPGNPIPVTMTVFSVLLCGMVLGSKLGAISQMQYITAGLLGAPVFTKGAGVGYAAISGLTGGYIIGFVVAAYLTGLMVERAHAKNFGTYLLAGLFGVAAIYTCGVSWMWALGCPQFAVVFLGIDAVKAAMAAAIVSRLRS